MNKDEIIEEMAKVINKASDNCFATKCEDCKHYRADDDYYRCKGAFEAEALYNANYRKVTEDEIVVKKSEYEALLLEQKRLKEMVDRIPCGYELKEITRQETAKEILQLIYNRIKYKESANPPEIRIVKYAAKKYGVELE